MFLKIWTAVDNGSAGSYSYASYRHQLINKKLTIEDLNKALESLKAKDKHVPLPAEPVIFTWLLLHYT